MPASALEHVVVDAVVPADRLAIALTEMVSGSQPPRPSAPQDQPGVSANPGHDQPSGNPGHGPALTMVCPDCGGVLQERSEAGLTQWECRVGHKYSPQSLVDAQAVGVEGALWAAIRALEDRMSLLQRMAERADAQGQQRSARSFRRRAEEASNQAALVRESLARAATTTLQRVAEDDTSGDEESAA